MLQIGKINSLKIVKQQGADIYLGSETSNKVLLIDRLPANHQADEPLDVFVYVDTEGHLAATTRIPAAQADDIAFLPVVSVNYVGAFLDWGLAKDLLVPFSEQHLDMEVGKSYLVKLFLDDKSRVLATTKINRFLSETSVYFKVGEKVHLIIAESTDLGVKAIINNSHWGMLYHNELFQTVQIGQQLEGYIKQIREDLKIDLTLYPPGYKLVGSLTDTILAKLQANGGELQLSDKSPPEAIYAAFGVSKKVFKQAIGALYKDHKIILEKTAIKLAR
ncbi:MAG: S1-like domain-containing RNA-binding protein [Methylovulum sp.]|nr:S1-like domain-containing RNA-binding protein [Methylovulum sp.]